MDYKFARSVAKLVCVVAIFIGATGVCFAADKLGSQSFSSAVVKSKSSVAAASSSSISSFSASSTSSSASNLSSIASSLESLSASDNISPTSWLLPLIALMLTSGFFFCMVWGVMAHDSGFSVQSHWGGLGGGLGGWEFSPRLVALVGAIIFAILLMSLLPSIERQSKQETSKYKAANSLSQSSKG